VKKPTRRDFLSRVGMGVGVAGLKNTSLGALSFSTLDASPEKFDSAGPTYAPALPP
jgi:hypothetical protein